MMYAIFLNLTRACNFRCKYCYEANTYCADSMKIDDVPDIISFIDNLKESHLYKRNGFDKILLTFFGGEPTLNKSVLKELVDYYNKKDDVVYSIVTNGSNLDTLYDIFLPIKHTNVNGLSKVHIQVSYDGIPIHDINRLDINGNPTGDLIKSNIKQLLHDGFNVSVKSVIKPDHFKYMLSAYNDIKDVFSSYSNMGSYFPTIDYYNSYKDDYCIDELEQILLDIAKEEIEFYNSNKRFFFTWFNKDANRICAAGKDMLAIDVDLSVYPCEGCYYAPSDQHLIGHIKDKDIYNKLEQRREYLLSYEHNNNLCKTCSTSTCFRCNLIKFAHSKKEDYAERWYDYTDQSWLCRYYITVGKIKQALYHILFNNQKKEEKSFVSTC